VFFRKITTRSNGKEYTYLKLIENYREGAKVKQRVIANFGSMDKLTTEKVNDLVEGLTKICGITTRSPNIETKKILRYGEVLAIHKIWVLLGMDKLIRDAVGLSQADELADLPLRVELLVMMRMLNSPAQQSFSDWYAGLYMPSLAGKEFKPEHFNRALEVISVCRVELGQSLSARLNSLMYINTDLAYADLTTLVNSFREIQAYEPGPNQQHMEQKVAANLAIGLLAKVLEKIMARLMHQAGLPFNARQALLLLEAIKVVIYQIDGQEFKSVTSISSVQEQILNAIGLNKEQRGLE